MLFNRTKYDIVVAKLDNSFFGTFSVDTDGSIVQIYGGILQYKISVFNQVRVFYFQ